ncbi:MAG: sigma-54 interaction domain-containing protein [Vicinamibacterales bacterium]
MDEIVFAARRSAAQARAEKADPPPDDEARFRTLVQSPLRAGLLRFLSARPQEAFESDALMSTFGRMRLDVDNCLHELVEFGVVRRIPGPPARYAAQRPDDPALAQLLDAFLERRAQISTEDQAPSVQRFREMIGRDEKMLIVFEWIRTAAKSDISVLILGPTGSGKEVVARMIHELSRRGSQNFQAVNCAALPDTLFESEVFGFEKGAFTGAHDRKPGKVELADRGTLFLDEIGDLSLVAQAKLLRVLEDRQFERLGGQKPVHVDFRLISATNRPLDLFVRDGRFREDLYYRVNAFAIRLPSLRERPVDIPVLANRFLARYCASSGLPLDGKTLSPEAMSLLAAYHWPGNIRELESTVSRAALSAPGRTIRDTDIEFLHAVRAAQPADAPPRLPTLRDAERAHILRVLDAVSWNKKEAARVLEISRGTLYRKILEYNLERDPRLSRNRTAD